MSDIRGIGQPEIGSAKSLAALGAGALTTILVTALTQGLGWHVQPELSGAVQTLITLIAVYAMPHSMAS